MAGLGASSTTFWCRRCRLELDVPRPLDELLAVHVGVLEARLRLVAGAGEGVGHADVVAHDAHPSPATAAAGLYDDGIADAIGFTDGVVGVLEHLAALEQR
jgi:hypothetical protein